MANVLEFTLNGRHVRAENVSPNTTLLEFLRSSGLTGSKEGCAEGDCGACSVALVEKNSDGDPAYRAINSCLVPICMLAGREVISVEGIAREKKLHPVQQKMVECHGSQCGYCTPGFIASLFEGYYRDNISEVDQLDDQLCGNLCRCTGYRSIREAAIEAFAEKSLVRREDFFASRLEKGDFSLKEICYKNNGEVFYRPTSLADLLQLLKKFPNARMIAGATELGLEITKKFKTFPCLISVEAVAELKEIKRTESEWQIGAAVTLTQIEEMLGKEFPALAKMLRVFGSRQIRNRATMGGNIVTASPIGDSAPVLLALDARVIIASPHDERKIPIDQFFIAYRRTALQAGEVLKTIIIPRHDSANGLTVKADWFKVSKRREMDISTVAACFRIELDAQNIVRRARLAYGGVAAMPSRALKAEQILSGREWNASTVLAVLPVLENEFTPISDVRGEANFRRKLISNLFKKFFSAQPQKASAKINFTKCVSTRPAPHESAHKHVTGEATYTDDQTAGRNMLEVWPVCSPHARARILRRDASAARKMPGIVAVLLAEDIPGLNDVGAIRHDEILLADKEVLFHGHLIALVVGETHAACRAAAAEVIVEYELLPPVLKIEDAIAQNSFHTEPNYIRRGEIVSALHNSPLTLEGEFSFGGQEHFYLESQAAWAEKGEDGSMLVVSSTQHPSEVQHIIAHLLAIPVNQVVVQSPRMGGGFGGKETQAATPAALAALAASITGKPVRVRFNRDQDMMLTGKRHPFYAKFKVGFDAEGMLMAAQVELISNGGWSLDLSMPVTDRAVFHLDNSYYIPNVEFSGRVAKTNLASNTAFRGFGGPQGMLVMEEIVDRVSRSLNLPAEKVREQNLYRGKGETNTTHYGQEIEDNRIQQIWKELKTNSSFEKRREEIAKWNSKSPHLKRGLALTPVKFGISFTVTHLNQAGALVLIYQDGTIQINHGGTEMGQGIHTNMATIAAKELGITSDKIRVMPTSTDKVPNTSATAASCGTDLNGAAVKNACEILRERLFAVAENLLLEKSGRKPKQIVFADNTVFDVDLPEKVLTFAQVVQKAYFERISLSATGFYRTPEIHYDRAMGRGRPFHYFAVGAAVAEVEVDGYTGLTQVVRIDILHDVGDSINPGINRGQIEGGFVQGMGWLTNEELKWNEKGALLTHSPDTYKIPAIGDVPTEFNVKFLENATQKNTIHGSKAVGEPPLMLAISVREAIRDAVAAFGPGNVEVDLPSPSTCEAIFNSIQKVQMVGTGICAE